MTERAPPPDDTPLPWHSRLRVGLARTRAKLGQQWATRVVGKIDEDCYEELEAALLGADSGVAATRYLLEQVRQSVQRGALTDTTALRTALREALHQLIAPLEQPLVLGAQRPFVLLIAGVNGVGKTTTIGKLAYHFRQEGRSVLLAAGDTFRAAAREQIAVWGERNGVSVIQGEGRDPAALCHDAYSAAQARGVDVMIADTAGRLPTQPHLMEELRKISRVLARGGTTHQTGAPHEVLLVLDATTGQNALRQLEAFDAALGVSGLIITKLDGSAKGGILAAIAQHAWTQRTQVTDATAPATAPRALPGVRFIGVGEGIADLQPFVARDYAEALLAEDG